MVIWMAFAVLLWGRLAQDAVPYQVAGALVRTQPHEVYASSSGDLFDLAKPFADRWCEIAPPGTNCEKLNVAYVSMPLALPLSVVFAATGNQFGVLLARLLAAGALVAGMCMLWKRLAGVDPNAPRYVVIAAALLTPMAAVPITLGQTSPYLFLLACVGVTVTDRSRQRWFVALLWAVTISLKLFPAVLGLVLIRQRQFRLLLMTFVAIAALAVATVVLAPLSIWADFMHMSANVTRHAVDNPYSGSIDRIAHQVWVPLTENPVASTLLILARLMLAGGLWWWGVRDADDDTQWAYGSLVVMLIVPLVWWHYLWVGIAALGIALARRTVNRRWLIALPIAAALTVPVSLANAFGHAWPLVQELVLIGFVILVPIVVRSSIDRVSTNEL
ncbi:MAG: glycosyltransferase family 87 protein [Actinomycetes bacterium]